MSELKSLIPQDVVSAYEKYKAERRGGGMIATSNWPTALAHECRAYAFWNRTVPPERRRPINAELAMIFSEGNDQGRMVKRDLEDAGFIVSDQESQMFWSKFQISGRKDLKIWKEGYREKINVEVKSCSRYTFEAINKPEDLIQTDKDWLNKWFKQIALYMVLQGTDKYWLLLKSKERGQIKIIEFKMSDQVLHSAESMLKKAEWVNRLIQIGDMPKPEDRIADADYCSECEFYDACLPDLTFGPGAVVFDPESVEEMTNQLERWEVLKTTLKPLNKEFKDLDDELKEVIKSAASLGQNKFVIGSWIAQLKEVPVKAFSVPARTDKRVTFLKP